MGAILIEITTPKSDETTDTWIITDIISFEMKREVSFNVDIGLPTKDAEERYIMPFLGQTATISFTIRMQYTDEAFLQMMQKAKYHASADLTGTQTLTIKNRDTGAEIISYPGRIQSISISIREPTIIDMAFTFKLGRSGV